MDIKKLIEKVLSENGQNEIKQAVELLNKIIEKPLGIHSTDKGLVLYLRNYNIFSVDLFPDGEVEIVVSYPPSIKNKDKTFIIKNNELPTWIKNNLNFLKVVIEEYVFL